MLKKAKRDDELDTLWYDVTSLFNKRLEKPQSWMENPDK